MGNDRIGVHKPFFLVEYGVHVFVRAHQPLHQHVCLAVAHHLHGTCSPLDIAGFLHELQAGNIVIVLLTNPVNHFGIPHQDTFYQPRLHGFIDRFN